MAHVTSTLAEIVATSPEAGRAVVLGPGVMEGLVQVLRGGCLLPQQSKGMSTDDAPDEGTRRLLLVTGVLLGPSHAGNQGNKGYATPVDLHSSTCLCGVCRCWRASSTSRLRDEDVRHKTARGPRAMCSRGNSTLHPSDLMDYYTSLHSSSVVHQF